MLKNMIVVVIEQNCSYNCHWACVQGWVSCKVKHEGHRAGAGQWKVTSSEDGGHSLTHTHPHTYTHPYTHIHIQTHTHTHTPTHTHKNTTHIHTPIHTPIHIQTYTYTHTHTHTKIWTCSNDTIMVLSKCTCSYKYT